MTLPSEKVGTGVWNLKKKDVTLLTKWLFRFPLQQGKFEMS